MVYVIQVCWQLASRIRTELQFRPDPAHKLSANLHFVIFSWFRSPCGSRSPLWGSSITHRHTTLGKTPLDHRWDLYLTTHNPHKRQAIHAPDGIRTRNPRKLAAADAHLRPHGHPGPSQFVNYLNIFRNECDNILWKWKVWELLQRL